MFHPLTGKSSVKNEQHRASMSDWDVINNKKLEIVFFFFWLVTSLSHTIEEIIAESEVRGEKWSYVSSNNNRMWFRLKFERELRELQHNRTTSPTQKINA